MAAAVTVGAAIGGSGRGRARTVGLRRSGIGIHRFRFSQPMGCPAWRVSRWPEETDKPSRNESGRWPGTRKSRTRRSGGRIERLSEARRWPEKHLRPRMTPKIFAPVKPLSLFLRELLRSDRGPPPCLPGCSPNPLRRFNPLDSRRRIVLTYPGPDPAPACVRKAAATER